MREMKGLEFVDQSLDLSDKKVKNCTFDGCVLTLRPGDFEITDCHFKDCQFVGLGWTQMFDPFR